MQKVINGEKSIAIDFCIKSTMKGHDRSCWTITTISKYTNLQNHKALRRNSTFD